MTEAVLPEIVARISEPLIKARIVTDEDVSIASDLMIELLQRKKLDITTLADGKITDLFLRIVDVVVHCDRSPTYEGQRIEALVLDKTPRLPQ
jgi:hypothetical protein